MISLPGSETLQHSKNHDIPLKLLGNNTKIHKKETSLEKRHKPEKEFLPSCEMCEEKKLKKICNICHTTFCGELTVQVTCACAICSKKLQGFSSGLFLQCEPSDHNFSYL